VCIVCSLEKDVVCLRNLFVAVKVGLVDPGRAADHRVVDAVLLVRNVPTEEMGAPCVLFAVTEKDNFANRSRLIQATP